MYKSSSRYFVLSLKKICKNVFLFQCIDTFSTLFRALKFSTVGMYESAPNPFNLYDFNTAITNKVVMNIIHESIAVS